MSDLSEPIISLEALADLPLDSYVLIDVRDTISYEYDTLPHAVSMPDIVEQAENGTLSAQYRDKLLVLFCMRGFESLSCAESLCALGYRAVSLEDGFSGWIRAHLPDELAGEDIFLVRGDRLDDLT